MNYLKGSLEYRTISVLAQSVETLLLHCKLLPSQSTSKGAGLFVWGMSSGCIHKYWCWFPGSSEDVASGQRAAQTADPACHYLRTQALRNCSFRVWQVPIHVGSDLKTAPTLIGWEKKRLRVWFSGGSHSLARAGTKQANSLKQSSQVQRFESWGPCSLSLEQSDKLAEQYSLNSY